VAPTDLAGLFLVGGSSRIPAVAHLLHTTLGLPPTVLEQPELAVAEGALHTDAVPLPPTAPAGAPAPPADPSGAPLESAPDQTAGHGWPGEPTLVSGPRRSRRRAVLAGLGVVVALVAGAGTAAALGAFSPGSGRNPATGQGASAKASSSATPMAFTTIRPSTLARNADLKKFLSGWDRYPTPWTCARADQAHTLGVAGQPSNSAQRGVPDEALFCKQTDLELYVTHYRSGAELDRQRYVGANQPLNSENDAGMPKGVQGCWALPTWGPTEHAVFWTDSPAQGAQETTLGVLATSGNYDLEQVWYANAAER
jgi:hypothetical protein